MTSDDKSTAIVVQCSCGRTFRIAQKHAGKKGRCPTCKSILSIPTAKPKEKTCPKCGSPLAADGSFCPECEVEKLTAEVTGNNQAVSDGDELKRLPLTIRQRTARISVIGILVAVGYMLTLVSFVVMHPEMSFRIIALLVALLVVPLAGAGFLRLSFRLFGIKHITYRGCWMAYLIAYVIATAIGALLFAFAGKAQRLHSGFFALNFGLALLVHFLVFRMLLGKTSTKVVLAYILGLFMFISLLGAISFPLFHNARKAARQIVAMSQLYGMGRTILNYSEVDNEDILPSSLDECEQKTRLLFMSSDYYEPHDIVYLVEYLNDNYQYRWGNEIKVTVYGTRGLDRVFEVPLLWAKAEGIDPSKIIVCFLDGHAEVVSKDEFERCLDNVIKGLRRGGLERKPD